MSICVSAEEWKVFARDSVVLIEPKTERHALLTNAPNIRLLNGCMERWLNCRSPELVSLTAIKAIGTNLDAAELLDFFMRISDSVPTVKSKPAGSTAGAWGDRSSQTRVFTSDSSTELERREQNTVQASAQAIINSADMSDQVRNVLRTLDAGDVEEAIKLTGKYCLVSADMSRVLECASDHVLQRALEGGVQPEFMMGISRIRSACQTRLERLISGKNSQPSHEAVKAVGAVRNCKFGTLRLLNLMDRTDSKFTIKDPLAAFASIPNGDAESDFTFSLARLQQLWCFSNPTYSADISMFCTALSSKVREARYAGVPWSVAESSREYSVSRYFAAVMKQVDQPFESLMFGGRITKISPPSIEWVKNGANEWNARMQSAMASASAAASAALVTAELIRAERNRSATGGARTAKSPVPSNAAQAPSTKKKKAAAAPGTSKAATKAAPKAAASSTPAAPSGAARPSASLSTRQAKTAELLAQHGTMPGRAAGEPARGPCYFHYVLGNCTFSDDTCKMHHGK